MPVRLLALATLGLSLLGTGVIGTKAARVAVDALDSEGGSILGTPGVESAPSEDHAGHECAEKRGKGHHSRGHGALEGRPGPPDHAKAHGRRGTKGNRSAIQQRGGGKGHAKKRGKRGKRGKGAKPGRR